MASTYYATQGGGTAYQSGLNQYRWIEPAPGIGAQPGDLVPEEWGVQGPFNSRTNELVLPRSLVFDDEYEELYN